MSMRPARGQQTDRCRARRRRERVPRRASALRRTIAAGGQTVRDHQVDRLPRPAAARERRVIRPARGAAPPAMPRTRLDVHRARRVAVPVRVRARIREARRPAPPAAPTPAARPPARRRSRARPRQATCCSRRPLRVDTCVLGGAADIDARHRLAPSPVDGARARLLTAVEPRRPGSGSAAGARPPLEATPRASSSPPSPVSIIAAPP